MTMALRPTSLTLIVAASAALLLVTTAASAQWMWKDDAGHTIASDQPPPIGTPASRILKQPRQRPATAAASGDAPKDATKADAPKSLADRELESKQHSKEAAEAAKKADDEAAKAKAMQENCTSVKSNLAALQAGGRAARFNDKGEKVYIDDAQRQDEINKQQGQVTQYCK